MVTLLKGRIGITTAKRKVDGLLFILLIMKYNYLKTDRYTTPRRDHELIFP